MSILNVRCLCMLSADLVGLITPISLACLLVLFSMLIYFLTYVGHLRQSGIQISINLKLIELLLLVGFVLDYYLVWMITGGTVFTFDCILGILGAVLIGHLYVSYVTGDYYNYHN